MIEFLSIHLLLTPLFSTHDYRLHSLLRFLGDMILAHGHLLSHSGEVLGIPFRVNALTVVD